MRLFEMFKNKEVAEERFSKSDYTTNDPIRNIALNGHVNTDIEINKYSVLEIPAVYSSVELITNLISSLPIELYEYKNNEVVQITKDNRLKLLNLEAEKMLDSYSMKKAFLRDMLLTGAGYIYINKEDNIVKSLHFVDESKVSFPLQSVDPIFKDTKISVSGSGNYETYEFLTLTKDGLDITKAKGIVDTNKNVLRTMALSMNQEKKLSATGGTNRGILKAKNKLSDQAISTLKKAWENLYATDNNNAIVLNEGIDFESVSQNSKDLQLNENKKVNSRQVAEMFGIPETILDGTANEETFNNFIKTTINPLIAQLEIALNRSLLLEREKGTLFFKLDTNSLERSDMKKRYESYQIALKNGFMTIDEVRELENYDKLPTIGQFIKLNLADVLLNPITGRVFNTNSSKTTNLNNSEENTPLIQEGGTSSD